MAGLIKRIMKELADSANGTHTNMFFGPICDEKGEQNLHHWQATIIGPDNTPYEGGLFHLDIKLPNDYPFKPPKIRFINKIYHPKVHWDGGVCCNIGGVLCD